MWIEAVLPTPDIDRLVAHFAPMNLALGAGHFLLTDPAPSTLVPDVGLRVACKAKVHWPVLGIDIPVTIHSLTVLVRLEIAPSDEGLKLLFKLEIENVDLAGVPKMFDHRITEMANAELLRKEVELSWAMSRTLTHSFHLPASMVPLESLDLTVTAARLKIGDEAIGLAVQFESSVTRRNEADPSTDAADAATEGG